MMKTEAYLTIVNYDSKLRFVKHLEYRPVRNNIFTQLAFLAEPNVCDKGLQPGPKVIKHFLAGNKLECLFLASLSVLI
jgi:hypothetical protein